MNVQKRSGPGKSPLVNKHEGTYEVPHVHDKAAPDDMFGHWVLRRLGWRGEWFEVVGDVSNKEAA